MVSTTRYHTQAVKLFFWLKENYLLQILVFIGGLMDATANISHLTDDLLQWSDLLASLCVLGHDVTIKADRVELLRYLMHLAHFLCI